MKKRIVKYKLTGIPQNGTVHFSPTISPAPRVLHQGTHNTQWFIVPESLKCPHFQAREASNRSWTETLTFWTTQNQADNHVTVTFDAIADSLVPIARPPTKPLPIGWEGTLGARYPPCPGCGNRDCVAILQLRGGNPTFKAGSWKLILEEREL